MVEVCGCGRPKVLAFAASDDLSKAGAVCAGESLSKYMQTHTLEHTHPVLSSRKPVKGDFGGPIGSKNS